MTEVPGNLNRKLQLIFPGDEEEVWVWSWWPDRCRRRGGCEQEEEGRTSLFAMCFC